MKKSEAVINEMAGETMMNDVNARERLSAFADGQLSDE